MKTWKTVTIVLVSIIVIIPTFFYICMCWLGWYIMRCRSCEEFNIDNIECRTGTNIVTVDSSWCRYNDTTQTKTAIFYMDMPRNETKEYISQNKLTKITVPLSSFKAIPKWNDSIQLIPAQQLFYKKGTYKKESWMVLFDSSTATLWVELMESN